MFPSTLVVRLTQHIPALGTLNRYTQLPRVLDGFGQIMQHLFGLSLSVFPALPSEAWAPGVLRCDAHLDGELVGTVYLDLCR